MTQTLENMAASGSKTQGVSLIETENGSTYRYLPNGQTQRTMIERMSDGSARENVRPAKDIIVFVPDYGWLQRNAPELLAKHDYVVDERSYEDILKLFKDNRGLGLRVTDDEGKVLNTNKEAAEAQERGHVYLSLVNKVPEDNILEGGEEKMRIPVSVKPAAGFYVFDSSIAHAYGKQRRLMHVGHKVTRVIYNEEAK